MSDEPRIVLRDAISLWRLQPTRLISDLVNAATDCLVAGIDSPSLRQLAGASPKESSFVVDALIINTATELGMADVLDLDKHHGALAVMLRRMRNGRMTPREVASRAHTHIGHEGPAQFAPFVTMADLYGEAEYAIFDVDELDGWMRSEGEAFLAGSTSPGPPRELEQRWALRAPVAEKNVLGRLRAWVRRRP